MRRLLLLTRPLLTLLGGSPALAEIEPKLRRSGDPQDLEAISRQSREAFYRCD